MTEPPPPRHLLLYGSLRRGEPDHRRLQLQRRLMFLRPVRLRGRLYDLGAFPGAVLSLAGRFVAELHAIRDAAVLAELDRFEGPQFERRLVTVGGLDAFIYVYISDPGAAPLVRSGDWLAWKRGRQASKSRPMPV